MIGQRVLDVEEPTMETSLSAKGSVKGTQDNESLTARSESKGVLHGKGQGIIIAGESRVATFAGEGIGMITSSGIKWRGSGIYRTSTNRKLAFLNNVVGLFEAEVDAEEKITEKIWEWK
jgi:hypothetical protein